jgi:mannose-6-phosphate isomerase-like protein (cupin superfamily)
VAGYTIKNLKEIDDAAPKFGFAPNLEARFVGDQLDSENAGISYQRLAPGFRIPFGHKHKTQEEMYVVVSGSGRVKLDDDVRDVKQWDVVRVGNGTTRNFEAGPEGMELIAIGAPGPTRGDAEMTQDWWTD